MYIFNYKMFHQEASVETIKLKAMSYATQHTTHLGQFAFNNKCIIYITYQIISKVLSVLMSFVLQPHISINIFSTVSWYILIDSKFCTLYIDAVHFFQNLIFLPFLSLLLYDVVKRFSTNFSFRIQIEIQIDPKHLKQKEYQKLQK